MTDTAAPSPIATASPGETVAPPSGGSRDRLITAVRGASMVFVLFVHIACTNITDGKATQPFKGAWGLDVISWFLVWVIGAFFFFSGALMKRSGSMPVLQFWRRRGLRLLVPYYLFVLIALPIEYVLFNKMLDVCGGFGPQKIVTWIFPLHVDCPGLAQGPGWFLMVFIPIVLAVPFLRRIYDSRLKYAFPIAGVAVCVVFDVLLVTHVFDAHFFASAFVNNLGDNSTTSFSPGALALVTINVFAFWTVVLYGGFFYADGHIQRLGGRRLLTIGIASLAVMVLFVVAGPYQQDAFGFSWNGGNQFPPTLTWLFGTVGWLALIVWARAPLERFSELPRVAPVIDWCSDNSLTILIWHMFVYELLWWAMQLTGVNAWMYAYLPTVLHQAVVFSLAVACTVPVVMLMARIESRTIDAVDGAINRLQPA